MMWEEAYDNMPSGKVQVSLYVDPTSSIQIWIYAPKDLSGLLGATIESRTFVQSRSVAFSSKLPNPRFCNPAPLHFDPARDTLSIDDIIATPRMWDLLAALPKTPEFPLLRVFNLLFEDKAEFVAKKIVNLEVSCAIACTLGLFSRKKAHSRCLESEESDRISNIEAHLPKLETLVIWCGCHCSESWGRCKLATGSK